MQEKNVMSGFRTFGIGAALALAVWAALYYWLGLDWVRALAVPMTAFATASALVAGPLTPIGRWEGPSWLLAVVAWLCTLWSLDFDTQRQFVEALAHVAVSAAGLCVTINWLILCSVYLNMLKADEQASKAKED